MVRCIFHMLDRSVAQSSLYFGTCILCTSVAQSRRAFSAQMHPCGWRSVIFGSPHHHIVMLGFAINFTYPCTLALLLEYYENCFAEEFPAYSLHRKSFTLLPPSPLQLPSLDGRPPELEPHHRRFSPSHTATNISEFRYQFQPEFPFSSAESIPLTCSGSSSWTVRYEFFMLRFL